MPDANGNFKGQGWSKKKELTWERIFAPKELTDRHDGIKDPVCKWSLTTSQKEIFMAQVAQFKP